MLRWHAISVRLAPGIRPWHSQRLEASAALTKSSGALYLQIRGSDLPVRRHAQESRPVFSEKDATCLPFTRSSQRDSTVHR
jgi:hypothetical protein